MGGRAGGEKYKVNNVLFKFAVDVHGLFNGDDYSAAKVCFFRFLIFYKKNSYFLKRLLGMS